MVWHAELVPPQWREGLIVNLFKKGDKEVPGNYRGITLLSVVAKVFCKILNNIYGPLKMKRDLTVNSWVFPYG